jgi:hypothetical protein
MAASVLPLPGVVLTARKGAGEERIAASAWATSAGVIIGATLGPS